MELAAILMLLPTAFMLVASPLKLLSPSALLAGAWALVYILQSIFARDMRSSVLATAVIFTITLSFSVGELLACGGLGRRQSAIAAPEEALPSHEATRSARRLKRVIAVITLLGAIGMAEYARSMGLFSARSLADLILIPGMARYAMYDGELGIPLYSRAGVLFAYPGVVLALGYYYKYKWRWWLVLPMINVVLFGAIQAGRAGVMIILLQVLITVYLKNMLVLRRSISRVLLNCVTLPMALMLTVFIGGEFLREGFRAASVDDVIRVISSFRAYLFGGPSAFEYWVDHVYRWGRPSLGAYSFSSLFSALGIVAQAPGVYNSYSPIASNGDTSNLYTAYRSFIDDFSILGACVFYLMAGLFIAFLMGRLAKRKDAFVFALIPLLSWLAFSPMYSLTYFNSFLLSCFMPFLLVRQFTEVSE